MKIGDILRSTPYKFYDVDGQIVFPHYNTNGNISTGVWVFLWVPAPIIAECSYEMLGGITRLAAGFTYGIKFDNCDDYVAEEVTNRISIAAKELSAFILAKPDKGEN